MAGKSKLIKLKKVISHHNFYLAVVIVIIVMGVFFLMMGFAKTVEKEALAGKAGELIITSYTPSTEEVSLPPSESEADNNLPPSKSEVDNNLPSSE